MAVVETDYTKYALLYRCGLYGQSTTPLGNEHLIVHWVGAGFSGVVIKRGFEVNDPRVRI